MKKNLFVLFVLSAVILTACGKPAAATPTLEPVPAEFAGKTNPFGPDAAADGAKIFEVNCAPCHSPQGHETVLQARRSTPNRRNYLSLCRPLAMTFFWRINTGKPGTSMAPWAGILTEDQIWQVISFLHTLK
ncbi:MAG: c-type cytochrome [Anaerolineales bacterium]